MSNFVKEHQALVDSKLDLLKAVQFELNKVIVGQKKLTNSLLIALLANGHILLEGVPGLAKTTAISTLAQILKVQFKRLQFTPDLLPSDLIGNRIFNIADHSFEVKKGPIFANFILADEINRSPAKVQSALLEAMQEKQVTIGDNTFILPDPFLVMATQNPIEQEGTYALPEAQTDRFLLKTVISYPTIDEELEILNRSENKENIKIKPLMTTKIIIELQKIVADVYCDNSLKKYIIDIVFASRNPKDIDPNLSNLIAYGASPRASIGLLKASKANAFLEGRAFVMPEDIKEIAFDVLRHRIIPSYEAEAEGINADYLISALLNKIQVP